MMRRTSIALFCILIASTSARAQSAPQPATHPATPYTPSPQFDPARDADADIRAAILEAGRTHRRVLLEVGGDWCAYCQQMAALFHDNKDLLTLRDTHFVVVPVYYDSNRKNLAALSGFPPIQGIPHIYILDDHGSVLHSQHVIELREHGNYSPAKVKAFLDQWSAAQTTEQTISQAP